MVLGTLQELPTKRLAQRALEAKLAEINSTSYRPKAVVSYNDFAQRWMKTVLPQHKPSSQNSEKVHMTKYIMPFFGKMNMGDISTALVQQFISTLVCRPKTVRNIYATFRTAWKTAKAWGYVSHNVKEGIVLPRLTPVERPSFTTEQMQQIISAAQEPFKTFFLIAAETGLRAGELCGLRVEDFDYANRCLRVRQGVWRGRLQTPKSASGIRSVEISDTLAEHILRFLAVRSHDASVPFLFATANGRPWDSRYVVRDKLQKLLATLGIPKAGLHAFRHGNATALISEGEDIRTVAARLGHSDPSITLKVYAHASREHSRKMANKLGSILIPSCSQVDSQIQPNV